MTLVEKQWAFSSFLPFLIDKAEALGYRVQMGELWRSNETCALYAKEGKGIRHSCHELRLATDIILWKDGMILDKAQCKPLYEPLGIAWEKLSTPELTFCWGGRFTSLCDFFHYSLEHQGTR